MEPNANEQRSPLEPPVQNNEQPIETSHQPAQNSEQLQQAKAIGKQYIQYFTQVLRRPFQASREVGEEHFQNALITIGLIVILFPLLMVLTTVRIGFGLSPASFIVQPLIYSLLGLSAAVATICGILKLQETSFSFKEVVAKYATLLVPVPILLILTMLFALIGVSASMTVLLFILSILFIIISINIVVLGYPAAVTPKLDLMYSMVIANTIVGYFFYKLIASMIGMMVASMFTNILPGLGGW